MKPKRWHLEVIACERYEFILNYQCHGLTRRVEHAILRGDTPSITPEQHLLRLQTLLTGSIERTAHGGCPLGRMDQQCSGRILQACVVDM